MKPPRPPGNPLAKPLAHGALALGAPLFAFAISEILLALIGVKPLALTEDPYVGFSSLQPLYVETQGPDGRPWYSTHPAKLTHFNPQSFPKEKGPKTYRIFCVGGSTTYGHPYRDPTSYSGWLRALLAKADTTRHYEVINAGGISYASYRDAALVEELSHYQPDLFVIYSGHNEFLEERTYRKLTALPAWMRAASAWLDRTRTYSALRRALRKWTDRKADEKKSPALASEVDDVLAKTVGPTSYTRDDRLKAEVLEHFRFSLDRMGRLAAAAGARILYVTTPVNERDCSPFKSEATPGLGSPALAEVATKRESADSLLAKGRIPEAYQALAQALSLDPRNAGLQYAAGRAAFASRRFPEAKRHFRAAIEEDICPLRALRAMDTAMRQAAKSHGGYLLDFVDSLERDGGDSAAHGILGFPPFLDHVHLDLKGYRKMALGLIDELARQGAVNPHAGFHAEGIKQVTDSLNAIMTPAEQGLALTNLAKVINWAGKHDEAAHLAEQALLLDSTSFEAIWSSLFVGALRERQGRGLESLPHFRRAVALDPSNPSSRMHLGGALLRLDSLDAAERQLDTAWRLAPQDPDIRTQALALAQRRAEQGAEVLLSAGKLSEAETAFHKRLQKNPGDARAFEALGGIALAQGGVSQAIQYYARALQLDPKRREAREALERLLPGMPLK